MVPETQQDFGSSQLQHTQSSVQVYGTPLLRQSLWRFALVARIENATLCLVMVHVVFSRGYRGDTCRHAGHVLNKPGIICATRTQYAATVPAVVQPPRTSCEASQTTFRYSEQQRCWFHALHRCRCRPASGIDTIRLGDSIERPGVHT